MLRFSIQRASSTLFVLALLLLTNVNANAEELTLAVANSTCNAIKKVGKLYQQRNPNIELKYICKSSGRLAKGLKGNSIEADIYISANRKWIDYMIDTELVAAERVVSPWGNKLVVATPISSNITNFSWEDLASDKVESILIGDPGTAPFGRYAKQALKSSGLWIQVRHKIHTKKHITLLAEVLSDSSPNTVGILFYSNVSESLRVIHTVDPSRHKPIKYFMAPLKNAQLKDQVVSLFNFIQDDIAQAIFLEEGFRLTNP